MAGGLEVQPEAGNLVSKDEPSNPFSKSPKKSAPPTKTRQDKSNRRGANRAPRGPPAPPGKAKQAPPVAPSSAEKTTSNTPKNTTRAPGRAAKSVGLRKESGKAKTDAQKRTDERAKVLIEASRSKVAASQNAQAEVHKAKSEPSNPFKKTQAKRTSPPRRGGRFNNKRNKPQGPAKRVKKLHRGKYMEFKYDVRRILEEENVEDEHRSNVLGQTWAKGERQGVGDAKEFLEGKVEDGIISEKCSNRIIKLIDSLTTRR